MLSSRKLKKLNESKLFLNFATPGHGTSLPSDCSVSSSDRPQHQMSVNICGNMKDVKHLQNLLIIFVMSQKLDIACRGFPLRGNKIWRMFLVKSFNICLPVHWIVLQDAKKIEINMKNIRYYCSWIYICCWHSIFRIFT